MRRNYNGQYCDREFAPKKDKARYDPEMSFTTTNKKYFKDN